ncbi:hypothetical protein [Haloferula sp.]|uniref:hypothetical protein n=1 Tax=Haloferula sp. TaxID=2497595 RepID=UPI00329CE3B0
MKISQTAAISAATITACLIVSTTSDARRRGGGGSSSGSSSSSGDYIIDSGASDDSETFPLLPSGWLTAFPTVVQTGTKPTITWGINYPSIVEDYVTITPPGTVTADEDIDCEIRVLGAGVTVTSSNSSSYSFVPTEATIKAGNGGSYSRIFYGTNHDANPDQVVSSFVLKKNQELNFGGRYYYDGWGTSYTSQGGTWNVRSLVNGMTPPSNIPDYNAPSLESFIKPYLGQDGKVNIGPMDVIVFMELTHTDGQSSNVGYDLQDMVLLVTFKSEASTQTNNGHGNNIDGIDSSNPGDAPFIDLDTDPNVDDEGSGGGAAPSNP